MRRDHLLVFRWTYTLGSLACVCLALFLSGCRTEAVKRPALTALIPHEGRSMVPTFSEDGMVFVQLFAGYDDLRQGDVVIYFDERRNGYIMHRIVAKQLDWWIVQGDNRATNPRPDRSFVTRENYVGKVVLP